MRFKMNKGQYIKTKAYLDDFTWTVIPFSGKRDIPGHSQKIEMKQLKTNRTKLRVSQNRSKVKAVSVVKEYSHFVPLSTDK